MAKQLRTFLAIELPAEISYRMGQLISQLKAVSADVRWVPPEDFHLTLKFLGNVRFEEIHEICVAANQACASMDCFDVTVSGLGAFPSLDDPHVFWMGLTEGTEQLQKLAASLDERLEPLGFRREARQFIPHLTLGRVKAEQFSPDLVDALNAQRDYFAGQMTVDGVTVFSSEPGGRGPQYEPLGFAPLR